MRFERTAGILLHPTSLPGFGGIGSLGPAAYEFVDTLAAAKIGLWQVLPLGPTGYGDSPYSALSAFAGNPLLVSLEPLLEQGLLTWSDVEALSGLPESRVDFGRVVPMKSTALRRSFERFSSSDGQQHEWRSFHEANRPWLEDVALFLALKDAHGGAPWVDWEPELRARQPDAIAGARGRLGREMEYHSYVQWLFFSQWEALKTHANGKGISIVGDIPIFVANDSADVWANQHLFQLDEHGQQKVLAGVPPDYFSTTGQLWGNPHYRWDVLQEHGFSWWIDRFRMLLRQVDIVRLDHFRGFAAAWAVPFGEPTAERGQWVPAPGVELFEAIRAALGDMPIIAEDLGVITPDVEELRDRFGFPGMHILQFAFGEGPAGSSLPHNLPRLSVVYTGTHDNDTTVGWYESISAKEQTFAREYTQTTGMDMSWALIRIALASVADAAIVPMQDVLRLGTVARMNLPGRPDGNWAWRFVPGAISEEAVRALGTLVDVYGRSREDAP
jgi:4-alpha-glucanotransferase